MAGSNDFRDVESNPSLAARLEGLKVLADHLEDPVVIFNPAMELVYANPSADRIAGDCPLFHPGQEGHESCLGLELTSCDTCPGKKVFEEVAELHQHPDFLARDSISSLQPIESPVGCPLPRAVPLHGDLGEVKFAVMMGTRGRESVVVSPESGSSPALSATESPKKFPGSPVPFIGESSAMQQLAELIQLVAASDATVLIQGESGTGKELVAKTIHSLSPRCARPFVVVDCSALSETLLESELFGHVRGAFTGAVANRKGFFEEAEGGTIFLDEIGDTTPAFQSRLLRVLQEGEIRPVGGNRSVKVNVRVISAANKILEELVHTKVFRSDLFYRLAVLPIVVPPLRERKDDIWSLVDHFLRVAARKQRKPVPVISQEGYQALLSYQWPGNVRELENLIERVVVTTKTSFIEADDLFAEVFQENAPRDLTAIGKTARHEAERMRIVQALAETGGDKTQTARLLHISRSSLYNKLRDYGISS